MKYKIEFYLLAFLLALSLNSSVMAGRTLDGTKVVSDEDIEYLKGEDVISASKFIRQARALDQEELEDVETLDLHSTLLGTSGLRQVSEELLPYLPNLKFLNLIISELREDEDLELLASILQRFENLQYVNIVGNGIAYKALPFVKEHAEQKELTDRFQKKVVFSFKSSLENQFPGDEREKYKEWYKTHVNYYTLVH
ncbi:MAG: hypothetical protein K2Y08_01915 [Alphaproteobacteria bacterium]|nr:hypothetical protein [Alphaproteobacteria bacterium]